MASNVQAGTRGLSAGDWVRLQRLRGANRYYDERVKDVVNPAARLEPESGRRVFTEVGTSKIRRPASSWIDYISAKTTDFVLERQDSETKSRTLTAIKVCTCDTTSNPVKKSGICVKCINS